MLNWRIAYKDFFKLVQKGNFLYKIFFTKFCLYTFWFFFKNCNFFQGAFELMIYASVNISKQMELFVKDDKGELTDADISSFQDWTTDIVRVPETWVFSAIFSTIFSK